MGELNKQLIELLRKKAVNGETLVALYEMIDKTIASTNSLTEERVQEMIDEAVGVAISTAY